MIKNNQIIGSKELIKFGFCSHNKKSRSSDKTIKNLDKILEITDISISDSKHLIDKEEILDFSKFKNLNTLYIYNANFKNIIGLEKTKIKEIVIIDSNLQNFDFLKNVNTLNKINFRKNQIEYISKLDFPENIKSFNLQDNKIKRIENLENYEKLKVLDLVKNDISKIENLEHLVNLEELSFNFNKIRKIENLDNLIQLKLLGFQDNKIKRIENLDKLINLEYLSLNENPLKYSIYKNKKEIGNKIKDIALKEEQLEELNNKFLSKKISIEKRFKIKTKKAENKRKKELFNYKNKNFENIINNNEDMNFGF